MILNECLSNIIQPQRTHPRLDMPSHFGERFPDQQTTLPHQLYFFPVLVLDHTFVNNKNPNGGRQGLLKRIHFLLHAGRYGLSALDTAAAHQTIVLAHEQLRFDLLQRVEDHPNHDQQGCSAEEG